MKNELFKALADPTRREILNLLREGDLSAGEIGGRFSMSAASISHHLALLRQAELVRSDKQGQFVIYSLNTTVFQEIVEWIVGFKKGARK